MDNLDKSLDKSSLLFDTVLKDHLISILGGGKIYTVEGNSNPIIKTLDMLCGIDYLFVKDGNVKGIASRIQETPMRFKPFNTFTVNRIRPSSLFTNNDEKLDQISHGCLYPVFSIQAYVRSGSNKLLSFCIAHTSDILSMVRLGKYSLQHTGKQQVGQAEFCVVTWDDLKNELDKMGLSNKIIIKTF